MDEPIFAPRPGDVKKVIVVAHHGGKVSTYDNLIEALTAVYRLDKQLKEAVETAVKMAAAGGGS